MAATKYTYSITSDFPNQLVDGGRLKSEIQSSAIITALDYVATSGDDCDVWFKDALSTGDETILDGIVAVHTGEPLPGPSQLEDGTTIVTLNTRSLDGTALVGKQKLGLGRKAFARIDDATENLNVDGRTAGSEDLVWDGDTTAWTLSGYGSATTEAVYEGTYGLDSGVVGNNTQSVFDYGDEVDVTGYGSLSFWLQPKYFPPQAKLRALWRDGSNGLVGSIVDIGNYVTNMDLNVWQHVEIPIADFNLTANVQRLWLYYYKGPQRQWIDNIKLKISEGGGPFTFRVSSPIGYVYHVERIILVISAGDTGWAGSAFANITGGLQNGLLVKYHKIGDTPETYWTLNSRDNVELFGQYEAFNSAVFDNSEQVISFFIKPELSSVILVDDDEVLDIIVRDDLSSLAHVRAFLHFGTEVIP
jgi:hypothetical protein